jgi:hypothetical protein
MKTPCMLMPATKRLKQLIAKHGNAWHIEAGPEPMQCFGNQVGVRIKSEDGDHIRNVLVEHIANVRWDK